METLTFSWDTLIAQAYDSAQASDSAQSDVGLCKSTVLYVGMSDVFHFVQVLSLPSLLAYFKFKDILYLLSSEWHIWFQFLAQILIYSFTVTFGLLVSILTLPA